MRRSKDSQHQRLGNWALLKCVAQRPNAKVWTGVRDDGIRGMVKVCNSTAPGSAQYRRFGFEVRALTELRDIPGVMPLLDCGVPSQPSRQNPAWYAMPKGVELDKHLNTASLDVVVAAIAQAAATLAAAANRCTFHRDLKPSNLFWLDGRTVVGDWGLVDMPDNLELTRSGQKLGSVYYIAPEMLLDAGNAISGPADVYSLAKTLWVLATRAAFPLQGEHRLDVPGLLLTTYRPHERGYLLDHLIDRSSRHEPAQRLTMAEIRDELAAWLALPSTMGEQPDLKDIAARIAAQTAPGRAEWVARQERLDSLKALLDRLRAQLEPLRLMAEEAGLAHPRVGHGNLLQNAQREFWPDEPVMLEGMTNYVTLSAGDSGQPWLCSGFAVDVIHQGPVRLFAGHYVQGQLNGKFELAWSDGRKASLGTALEQAAVDDLINGLTSSFEAALEAFIRVA